MKGLERDMSVQCYSIEKDNGARLTINKENENVLLGRYTPFLRQRVPMSFISLISPLTLLFVCSLSDPFLIKEPLARYLNSRPALSHY